MESLTGQSNETEASTEPTAAPGPGSAGKPQKAPDRIALGQSESRKVDQWLRQLNETSRGFLNLSRSEMVNFLIREHREELHASELKRVRADHYDPIKHMQWIMPQIKDAWHRSDGVRVAELQEELRGVEISVVRAATAGSQALGAAVGRESAEMRLMQPAGGKKRGRKPKADTTVEAVANSSKNTDSLAKMESNAPGKEPF